MTAITGTIDTYDFGTAHMREDLADVIFDVSRRDAPFLTMIGKTKATSRTHDWVTDSLGSAVANAQVEGDEHRRSVPAVSGYRVHWQNICWC